MASVGSLDTGLDLRYKAVNDEESNDGEMSDSGSEKKDMDGLPGEDGEEKAAAGEEAGRLLGGGGRSRRKPAAPQWVNPDWPEANEREEQQQQHNENNIDQEPINGVCVRNLQAFGDENQEGGSPGEDMS